MSDSVLHHLTERLARKLPEQKDDDDFVEDHVAFGWQRGNARDRCYYLELRRQDGSIAALPYMMLERIDFDPSEGITLTFANQTVRIVGRNLNAEVRAGVTLLNGILRNKVPWVQESGQASAFAPGKNMTVIEAIKL